MKIQYINYEALGSRDGTDKYIICIMVSEMHSEVPHFKEIADFLTHLLTSSSRETQTSSPPLESVTQKHRDSFILN
jgi:hypothetical protein